MKQFMPSEYGIGNFDHTSTVTLGDWEWYNPMQYNLTTSTGAFADLCTTSGFFELPSPARDGFENVWHFIEPTQEAVDDTVDMNEPDNNATLDTFLAEFKIIPPQGQ